MSEQKDLKDTSGKPLPLLMPYEALEAFSEVSFYANKKYGNCVSWKYSMDHRKSLETYSNALARHLFKYDQIDEESGLPHIYPVVWNAAVACWHYKRIK